MEEIEINEIKVIFFFEDYFINIIQDMFIVGYEMIVYVLIFVLGYLVQYFDY